MRLRDKDVGGILKAISCSLGKTTEAFELFLFGSRVADEAKGGDIDLLLLVGEGHRDEIRKIKRVLIGAIQKEIGDRRIDLTISGLDSSNQSEFVKSILPSAVKLFP